MRYAVWKSKGGIVLEVIRAGEG